MNGSPNIVSVKHFSGRDGEKWGKALIKCNGNGIMVLMKNAVDLISD